ncbi:MAG TPA: glycosyltransferase [Acidimicrobiales bacterium]|nr:glycosyltransferase [Acidimicrobiales bacterium]
MRLLVVTNGLPPSATGGAEALAYQTSEALAERHEVLVLSGTPAGPDPPFPVTELPLLPKLPPTSSPARKIAWHVRDQWRPGIAKQVVRELRRHQPDVAVTHNVQGLSAAVFTALGRCRTPHLHMAHDLNLLCARTSMTKGLQPCSRREPECLVQRCVRGGAVRRRLDLLVTPSEFVRARHVEFGIVPEHAAVVLPHAVRAISPRVRRLTGESLQVGFIGTLVDFKGVATLLDAFEGAPEYWRLAIAGSGPLQARVEQAARADRRISYWGQVSGPRKDEFYDGLDLLVVPSECEETSPLVVAEAAARGIPSIVSDRGGLPYHHGVRVFSAGNADALLDAIRWFPAVPDRLAQCSAGLIAGHQEYSWDRYVQELEDLLHIVRTRAPLPTLRRSERRRGPGPGTGRWSDGNRA